MPLNVNLLQAILFGLGVNTESYGKGEAKNVADLLKEVLDGECYLKIGRNGKTGGTPPAATDQQQRF